MTKFVDDSGMCLSIDMHDRKNKVSFEDKFFDISKLDKDKDGRFIVDDIDHLISEVKAAWTCLGDYSNGEPDSFDLTYTVTDKHDATCIWEVFASKYIAEMAKHFDVSVSACI